MKIVIINYGAGNIQSIKFAIKRLGFEAVLTDDVNEILAADKVIFPGVGEASSAMSKLRASGLDTLIPTLKQPVLGICLGMQLMVESSAEGSLENRLGDTQDDIPCLSLMPGRVARMEANGLRLPHMGWNTVSHNDDTLFKGIPQDTYFYFVHSFAVPEYAHTLASCNYGNPFSAAINKDNFFGVQFHPERSSDAGAQLLTNFVNL